MFHPTHTIIEESDFLGSSRMDNGFADLLRVDFVSDWTENTARNYLFNRLQLEEG